MNEHATIVVDIDGVLAEFTYAFSSLAVKRGLVKKPWTCGQQLTWEWGVLIEQKATELWDYIHDHPDFWYDLFPLVSEPEIDEFRAFAADNRLDVIYMTDRFENASIATKQWLSRWMFPPGELVIAGNKVKGIASCEIDHLLGVIDDKPRAIEALRDAGHPVTIRDWQYNRGIEDVPRVSSLGEWVQILGATL